MKVKWWKWRPETIFKDQQDFFEGFLCGNSSEEIILYIEHHEGFKNYQFCLKIIS